jgi:hypothetical protein
MNTNTATDIDSDFANNARQIMDEAYLRILAAKPAFSNISAADHTHTKLCHNCPL